MSGWRSHVARLPKDVDWHLSPRRFEPAAALSALLLHGLALLAWQPMAAPPPREVVLRAVVLPTIEAQAEAPRAEPPPQQRAPTARASASQATFRDAGAAWSEDDAPAMAATSPSAMPAMPALADARSPTRALADAGDAAAPAVTEVAAQVLSVTPRRVDGAPTFARQAGASLAMAQDAGADMTAPAALAGRAAPLSRPAPGMAAASRTENARLADVSAALPAIATPGAGGIAPAPPASISAAPLAHAPAPSPRAAAEAPRAARPDMVAGDAPAAAASVPAGNAVASTELAGVARTGPPLAAGQPSAGGGLSEAAAAAARAAPSTPAPALLARAAPGRPMPVRGGGEGAFDSVDYADDNPEFVYPRLAIRLGLQGTVLLEVEVLPDGRPGDIRLKQGSGHELLDRDALRQMATWRFKPQVQRGRAQTTRVTVPVNYRLDAKGRP